jgi:hypothetical protein
MSVRAVEQFYERDIQNFGDPPQTSSAYSISTVLEFLKLLEAHPELVSHDLLRESTLDTKSPDILRDNPVDDIGRSTPRQRGFLPLSPVGRKRKIVQRLTLKDRAMALSVSPASRRAIASFRCMGESFGLRPNLTPRAIARRRPSRVQARSLTRQYFARQANKAGTISSSSSSGAGGAGSARDMNKAPFEAISFFLRRVWQMPARENRS